VDAPEGRYYVTPEGNHYTSVTTFLSKSDKSNYIAEWRAAVGEAEADRVSNRAANRGTLLHENAETYLTNNIVAIPKVRMMDISLMKGMIPSLDRISNIRLLEAQLYSDNFKLAGTVDCVADFDGVPSIIDFKTSSKLKGKEEIDNYFIQTSIYSWMVEERYGIKIPQIVILISQEFGSSQIFIENRKNWVRRMGDLIRGRNNANV
jgi:genome maintenance exonuclease 1